MNKKIECYVQIQVKGCDRNFFYHVSAETWERFDAIMERDERFEDEFHFFCFDTKDGRAVSISVPDIEFMKFTMDPEFELNEKAVSKSVRLYFRDSQVPLDCSIGEDADAFYLDSAISNALITEPFYSFLDNNEERCSFNLRHLLVMELDLEQVGKGRNEEQLGE